MTRAALHAAALLIVPVGSRGKHLSWIAFLLIGLLCAWAGWQASPPGLR